MKRLLIIICFLAAALHLPAQTNLAPVRLAIVPETSEAGPAADLLTAEFSKNDHVQLLERAEIEKVYREQGLSAGNQDYLKLGRVLGADGLLILHLSKGADSQILSLRLVAIKPGMTLRQREYPWPLDNQLEWPGVVDSQFQPQFSKLAVLPKDALPVSILNLRSAVASAQGEMVEREITQLLYARLANEKDIFVLERRRLELLAEENQLNDSAENTFWNGSYLIEGVIDKTGYQKGTVTIDLQLAPADKKEALLLEVSGARTNLPGVVNELAGKILAALKTKGSITEWNPQTEASQYLAEAQWMLKWRMYLEAKSAGEAAWALGRQNPEVALLRIKAYQGSAGDPGICVLINDMKRVFFGRQINPNVVDFGQIATYASAPDMEQFADMVRADELFRDTSRSFLAPDQKPDPAWLDLGESILDQTSLWLRYFYFTAEARSGQESRIADAKKLCLAITELIDNHQTFTNSDTEQKWLHLKARHLAFWMDTPEQCLPLYRSLIDAGQWPLIRRRFLNASDAEISLENQDVTRTDVSDGMGRFDYRGAPEPAANLANPCLTGWTWMDRRRCPEIWNSFIGELCGSSRPSTALEGQLLRCSYSWSEADFERNLDQLFDYVRQHGDDIIAANLDSRLLDDLQFVVDQRAPLLSKERRSRVQEQSWVRFKKEFATLIQQRQASQDQHSAMEMKKNYLNSQTNFDFISFSQILINGEYDPQTARELLPLVTNYEVRINDHLPEAGTNYTAIVQRRMRQQEIKTWVGMLLKRLNDAVSPPSPETNRPAMVRVARPALPSHQIAMPGASPGPANVTSAPAQISTLDIGRFWAIPTPEGIETYNWPVDTFTYNYNGESYVPQIASCCYRNGKLWVEVRYDESGFKGRADFFGIDLDTFDFDKVEYQGEEDSLPDLTYRGKIHPFEVHDGFLYLSLGNAIKRYSLKDHSWEQFPVPAEGRIVPVCLGDRLFFTSATSILEYAADGSFQTLASSRRRPATTSLDSIENYGSPYLFLMADNTLHVRIGGDIYAFSSKTGDWLKVATVPQIDESSYCPFDDGFLTGDTMRPGKWWGMFGGMSSPESLFPKPWPAGTLSINNLNRSESSRKTSTRWHIDFPGINFCVQGSNLWFLANAPKFQTDGSRHLQNQASNDPAASLIRFTPDETLPMAFPMRFKTDEITLMPVVAGKLRQPGNWDNGWILQGTPQGVVLIRWFLPGFWFIPKADLEQSIGRIYSQRHLESVALDNLHAQWRKDLLAAYDRNHDGFFGPDEREAMINNPHYLELELPAIDANTNGLLDAEELRFFDANGNGVLEPEEQQAIETTLSLLTQKLMMKLNPDANGQIDPADLPAELTSFPGSSAAPHMNFVRPGINNAAKVGGEQLAALVRTHLTRGLRIDGNFVRPIVLSEGPIDGKLLFKSRIEQYWKLSGAQTGQPGSPAPSQP